MELYYKIKSKRTGLFNIGTTYDQWSTEGKIFKTKKLLQSFIKRSMKDSYMRKTTDDWEIIEFEVRWSGTLQLHEMFDRDQFFALMVTKFD